MILAKWPSRVLTVSVALLWCAGFAIAVRSYARWFGTPGVAGAWPGRAPQGAGWRLLVVAHTQCPCTQTTLEELRDLLEKERSPLAVTVVLTGPNACSGSSAPNVVLARTIPGAKLEFVGERAATKRYGAFTSGQTFLFSPQGEVRFSGGLTDGRGHGGSSQGCDAIRTILAGMPTVSRTPVYGCALQTPMGDQ